MSSIRVPLFAGIGTAVLDAALNISGYQNPVLAGILALISVCAFLYAGWMWWANRKSSPELKTQRPGSIHVPPETKVHYTYTPIPDQAIFEILLAELADRMIVIADRINKFLEHERQNKTEKQMIEYYDEQFCPVVKEIYEEAKRRQFSDDLIDPYYRHPASLENIQIVAQRLGDLGRVIKDHAIVVRHTL